MENTQLILQGLLGLVIFYFTIWLFSEDRKQVKIKQVFLGVIIQAALIIILSKIYIIKYIFLWLGEGVMALKDATITGTSFVFGYLGGKDAPFTIKDGADTFLFAFQSLPIVIVVSAFAMLLFHWRILPIVVKAFSKAFQKTMNVGGALGVCCAIKIFLGQAEAPLFVRPYLSKFTKSELLTLMTAGMATTSSSIMIVYAMILENTITNPITHILMASIINIPAAITISRILIPEVEVVTSGHLVIPYQFSGSIDAISQGTSDGIKLYINILAMLIVFLSLVALVNSILSLAPLLKGQNLSLQLLLGYLLSPFVWLMGIPWEEARLAGSLLGKKTILNEVIAFIGLAELPKGILSQKTNLIMTYALCGYANLGSIGIQIGSLGTLVPERRQEIISLGFKAMIAGSIASCMTATIIGILYDFI